VPIIIEVARDSQVGGSLDINDMGFGVESTCANGLTVGTHFTEERLLLFQVRQSFLEVVCDVCRVHHVGSFGVPDVPNFHCK
jgi:hypothetical protein